MLHVQPVVAPAGSSAVPAVSPEWPAAAIHDTVAAIVRHASYHRSLRSSVLQRLWNRLWDSLGGALSSLREMPFAREIAIGVTALIVLIVFARVVYVMRLGEDAEETARTRRSGRSGTGIDPAAEAQRLAAEGRFTEAAHALYRGLLESVARRERLRLHPSKTSGDYARELRARGSSLATPFREFGRRYDRLLFGHDEFDAPAYSALLADARRVIPAERAA